MEDTCKASILNSDIWDIFTVYEFTINLRINALSNCTVCLPSNSGCDCISKQKLYSEMLLSIGNGFIDFKTVFPHLIPMENNH